MLIKLRQTEIEEALQQYIASQGINLTGKHVKIDFTASRSADGLTADVDITNSGQPAIPAGTVNRALTAGEVGQVHEEAPAASEEAPAEPAAEEGAAQAAPANSLFS